MDRSVAEQIAKLLNNYNNLKSHYTGDKIIYSKADYFPEQYEGLVFGSVALQRLTFMLSEVKHLVVHPFFRGCGLGHLLLKKAESAATTPLLYATVRETNKASIYLFQKAGYKKIARVNQEGNTICLLMKRGIYK